MMKSKIGRMVLGSAVKKPATRLYPFEKREPFPATRGRITMDIHACNLCTLCTKRCPPNALTVDRQAKTWQIDRWRCILCGACVSACPRHAISMETHYSSPETQKGLEIYRQSSPPTSDPEKK